MGDEAFLVKSILEKAGAIKNGHFLLASGFHSNAYVQCARLSEFPWLTEELIKILSMKLFVIDFNLVISPAVGAIIFGYEIAKKFSKPFFYAERVNGKMMLRRDFNLQPTDKVLVVEDVITTGGSSLEVVELIKSVGASIAGFASIVLRGEVSKELYPFYYLLKLSFPKYGPQDCQLCKDGIPLQIPGTKQLNKQKIQ